MPRRTAEQAEQTRQAILRSARQHFADEGFSNASLASIVNGAKVTKGALFHHFPNKLNLFQEVWTDLQRGMDAEARVEARKAVNPDDPYAQLLAGAKIYLKWAAKPAYYKIVLFEGPAVLGMQGWYESDRDIGQRNIRRSIRFLAEKGKIDPARVTAYAVLVQSVLNGFGFALGKGTDGLTPEAAHEAFELMLRRLS
ncbi:MAG: TetR family transcriptional regulator [Hyphomonas sp.]|nr:TetR family transcriptional regulator [Hyphomonas sp.]MCB9972225.1 TetR family transcriptional regulator [Hyphomonas sp.]